MVIIIDSAGFVQCLTNILGPLCSGRVRPLAQAAAPTADSADNTQHSSLPRLGSACATLSACSRKHRSAARAPRAYAIPRAARVSTELGIAGTRERKQNRRGLLQ
jgi:hypothetical protein